MADVPVYTWGDQSFSVSPQVAGQVVKDIEEREGYCAPSALVAAAMSKTSPLHKLFTWDNKKAAERWRNHEARQVIRNLTVVITNEDREERMPAFVSVGHTKATQDSGEGYRSIDVVQSTAHLHAEAVQDVLSRLEAFRRRYEAYEPLIPVWIALDRVRAELERDEAA